jgi:hypothetical protein
MSIESNPANTEREANGTTAERQLTKEGQTLLPMIRLSLIIFACLFILFELSSCRNVAPSKSPHNQFTCEDRGRDEHWQTKQQTVVFPNQLPLSLEGMDNPKKEKLKDYFEGYLGSVTFHISEIRAICSNPLKIQCYFNGGNSWTVLEWNGASEDWDTIGGGETITDETICRFPPEYVKLRESGGPEASGGIRGASGDRPLDDDKTEKDATP